ncbi:MAG: exonuclease [Planctomycetota bacterium]|nr:MAG: exonuclease [Planctomycetota bacterium]
MLETTYIHIAGIGRRTERAIHRERLVDWRSFLKAPPPINPQKKRLILESLPESLEALERGDITYFSRRLPPGEHWRLLDAFRSRAVFLDIETCSPLARPDSLTVVGLYDERGYRAFVAGVDMHTLPQALQRYDIIVTYNGKCFDIPFLISCGLHFLRSKVVVDLMHLCHRLGIRGGLKGAEQALGIRRPAEVAGMNGYDAVVLWRRHLAGSKDALPLLLTYNRCDTCNLAALFDALKTRLIDHIRGGGGCA